MRMLIGAIVLALGMAAQPAFAAEGSAMPAGAAPLFATTISTGLIGPVLADLRLPTVTLAPSAPTIALDENSMLRRRFTGVSMMEFYPVANSGFHLSAGVRLYSRRNFSKETEDSAHGLLATTRVNAAPIVSRAGLRKFNPALTAGYTMALSAMTRIGVEGGAMMGRLFASAPGLPHHAFGSGSENSFRPNAVANLVFGMHF